jgi:hypothetical protein
MIAREAFHRPQGSPARPLHDLCYSLADQNVATTKSIGIYNFSVQLLHHLIAAQAVDRLTVLTNPTLARDLNLPAEVTKAEFSAPTDRGFGRILWDQWRVYSSAARSGSQWLFLPKGFASFFRMPPIRVAAFVHDVMADYYRQRFPGFESPWERRYFSRGLRATLSRASVVFTNTDFSRNEILALATRWGLPVPNVVRAGYGFEPQPIERTRKEDRVLLFASRLPHKRTDLAIEFLDRWLTRSGFEGQVDCIGILSGNVPKPTSKAWNWIGRVRPAEGRAMIRRSRVVVYVSEYEGFGMPPVEAVLEGTCPVYSDIPPLREVMGCAGFAFANSSSDDFAAAMDRALKVAFEEIEVWAVELLARHNWSHVVNTIVGELAGAANGKTS